MSSKRRRNDPNNNDEPVAKKTKLNISKAKSERCDQCKQNFDNIPLYNGHPDKSSEEFIALTDEKLSIFTDQDDFPTHKITHFSVYDEKGHLCGFDAGLIEENVSLRFSGYIKKIDEDDSSIINGVPAYDLGPILEWYTIGYDGGITLAISFSTEFAEYILMEPSQEYSPIFDKIRKKIKIMKVVIDFLLDNYMDDPSYEDLVRHLESIGESEAVEDLPIHYAQFVCDQVVNVDKSSEEEKPLISLPCMRSLVKLAGVTFKKRKSALKLETRGFKTKKPSWTRAVTTKFVHEFFGKLFPDQLDNDDKIIKKIKKQKCGICEACQSPDCGECSSCKDMPKFGGTGKLKQSCKQRNCPYMAIMAAEISDNEDEIDDKIKTKKSKQYCKKIIHKNIKWGAKAENKFKGFNSYSSVTVGDMEIKVGDFVTIKSEPPNEPLWVVKVVAMYENSWKKSQFHGLLFCRSKDTILADTAEPQEIFLVDECDDLYLGSIFRKANVKYIRMSDNWSELGGTYSSIEQLEDNGEDFYFSKRFENKLSRFVDIKDEEINEEGCISCKRKAKDKKYVNPDYDKPENVIKWKKDAFKVGSGVLLKPEVYEFTTAFPEPTYELKSNVDPIIYPEYYRKKFTDSVKGSNVNTPRPFIVGIIEEILNKKDDIEISVRLFCRPEETGSRLSSYTSDLTLVYWTGKVITTSFKNVTGKCYVTFSDNVQSVSKWSHEGPLRFYFGKMFDLKNKEFCEVPLSAQRIGTVGKGGKSKSKVFTSKYAELPPAWEKLQQPLRSMDIFAGCGGLTEGLHQSGVCDTKWAIELDKTAAEAFRKNFPDAKVFTQDCNMILKDILDGKAAEKGLPVKGQVEMLVGGPPCQGFSGMNRFSAGQYSRFKNSLVATYLSFCEYYRPKYFMLENVRNFVSFKKGMVLKLTISCLSKMGYQVTWGIVQAGHHGVPQTRRRLILMAAAPNYSLPRYPEPLHVFNKRGALSFVMDNSKYSSGCEWTESAPFRTITVKDAMGDLPEIKNGSKQEQMRYDSEASSHFQRLMRGPEESLVRDHVCKEMTPIVEARIAHIPTAPGSDWRDLPNKVVKLNDQTSTTKLLYPYKTKSQKLKDPFKGVCRCATGHQCDPTDRQSNTLIPWCLPHTGDRHSQWAGLYGRLEWYGYFSTTITNPEPMGKQGRVLHPDQNRVVSVRECARSQGFPDKFQFQGSILDKHRQIGNAVPPPMGLALGREILKALNENL
ncbi:unnamed protein product [Ceutorhynchus assimilis]|uniref:Cytosine-specific methyltransferase n=1 Tax=Ceutorhynchus assimilis TaxID=467358 RepID=A0A9N9MZH8_9CUCU|nr:unnamed protein product [Ceutorhynchus assimilis]